MARHIMEIYYNTNCLLMNELDLFVFNAKVPSQTSDRKTGW